MTMPDQQPVFDHQYVAHVFNQRGYHVNEFATRLDMSNGIVEAFLRGNVEPGELRIATLANMANLLGIPLHAMFARPAPPPDPDDLDGPAADDLTADAEQLLACVYDIGRATPTLVSDIAKAFDWTLDRTYAAATEANRRLQPAGLAVNTSHGELFVAPVNDHLDAHKALTSRKVYERGLSLTHYKAAHQILTGQAVTVTNSGRQRLRTLGGMVNLGILTQAKQPAFTGAALEAFL
ncbi:hypothetical protein [Nocardioides caricicola]|uniref:HTH cro/C1-type domain-containing protein n=1 Tax=Nocardioides caricicola TaxID=634770 RepID=A0ABW0MZ95_9ACTN